MSEPEPERESEDFFLEENENTDVDLGDDLLRKPQKPESAEAVASRRETNVATHVTTDVLFRDARILEREGLWAQSKALLRKILRLDSHDVRARKLLEEIQEKEIQQWIHKETHRENRATESELLRVPLRLGEIQKIAAALENDLGLDSAERRLTSTETQALKRSVDRASMNPHDRVELGIGFFEMRLFELAEHSFRFGLRAVETESGTDVLARANLVVLLAQALVAQGKFFDASAELDRCLPDADILGPARLELTYWMGRAHEGMENHVEALKWYETVRADDRYHRDTQERIDELSGGIR